MAIDRTALLTQAVALHRQGRLDDAERAYAEVLRLLPGDPDATHLTGVIAHQRGDYARAIELINGAIQRGGARAEFLVNLGAACRGAGRLGDAMAHYKAALKLDPRRSEVHNNLGNLHQLLGDGDAALASFRAALALAPDDAEVQSNLLYTLNLLPGVTREEMAAQHRAWGEAQARAHPEARAPRDDKGPRDPERPLRVGLVSSDLRTHSVSFFLAPWLVARDRAQSTLVCYSAGARRDATTARLRALADDWVEVHGQRDEVVAARVRADRTDVLIDLAGHTSGNRLGVFARRPAPVQVTWLGYPNTTGLKTIDARIVDAITDPEGTESLCTESLVRLPGGFLCYEPWPAAPAVSPPPAARDGRVAFGSFNNIAKVGPGVLQLWSEVLRACPDSVLVLKSTPLNDPGIRALFEARFKRLGIPARRLKLLREEPTVDGHLARYAEVDIALDPFPYGGTTTTCEALWMGLPVVTLEGEVHAARVGASLLQRVGLPHLVARSRDDYVAIARRLAGDVPALVALRASLRGRMAESPLCDSGRFAREFEGALRALWRAWCAGHTTRP